MIIDCKRGQRIIIIEVKQRSMPGEMDRIAGLPPCWFCYRKKFKPLLSSSLHLHDVGDDMYGPGMVRVQQECTARHLFSPTILAVFFETESVHCENTSISR